MNCSFSFVSSLQVKGHLDVIEALLAAGADPSAATTTDGVTPMFIAAQFGHLNVVNALLSVEADPSTVRP
jgi:ankyrin repeat protein